MTATAVCARVAPSVRTARIGWGSRFSITSAFSFPRIPALWSANANTAAHTFGPTTDKARKAHMYSGMARRKMRKPRVSQTRSVHPPRLAVDGGRLWGAYASADANDRDA